MIVYTLTHYDTHFGTVVDVYSSGVRAINAAESLLHEHEISRHGEKNVERQAPHGNIHYNVDYGPEGAYITVERKTVID